MIIVVNDASFLLISFSIKRLLGLTPSPFIICRIKNNTILKKTKRPNIILINNERIKFKKGILRMKNKTILFNSQKNIRIAALTVLAAGFLFNVLAADSFALPNQLQTVSTTPLPPDLPEEIAQNPELRAVFKRVIEIKLDRHLASMHNHKTLFNMDISGGLPAVIIKMLMASDSGKIRLLPALPDAWLVYGTQILEFGTQAGKTYRINQDLKLAKSTLKPY